MDITFRDTTREEMSKSFMWYVKYMEPLTPGFAVAFPLENSIMSEKRILVDVSRCMHVVGLAKMAGELYPRLRQLWENYTEAELNAIHRYFTMRQLIFPGAETRECQGEKLVSNYLVVCAGVCRRLGIPSNEEAARGFVRRAEEEVVQVALNNSFPSWLYADYDFHGVSIGSDCWENARKLAEKLRAV